MANPVNKTLTHQTVTIVATAVNSCDVHVKQGGKKYYHTYVTTGSAAPAAPADLNNPDIDYTGLWVEIDNFHEFRPSASSDLYLWCTGGSSSLNGNVRIDV